MLFVPVATTVDDKGWLPIPSSPAMRQIEIHLGAAVIKVPEDLQAKHLTMVLHAVKAAL